MTMTETHKSTERRSSRVFTRIPVRATGKDVEGRKFRENSQTIVINAHGGLLYLHESLISAAIWFSSIPSPKKSKSAASSILATHPTRARA